MSEEKDRDDYPLANLTVQLAEALRDRDVLTERCEVAEARVYLLWESLALLVAFVDRIGGYMEHDEQAALRRARTALAEVEKP